MNINWKLIKEKYPKSYEKFLYFIKGFLPDDWFDMEKLYKYICSCDLESFFDENGIIIEIQAFWDNFTGFARYGSTITSQNIHIDCSDNLETRDKAEEQAVFESFEIMEGIL
jgi:hypothetical protein